MVRTLGRATRGERPHGLARRPRGKGGPTAVCEVCGHDDMAFEVHAQGAVHTFDSLECAISRMAPRCEHCGCTVIGHGVQVGGQFFCCAHCASRSGARGVVDRV